MHKEPRVLIDFLITRLRLSMALAAICDPTPSHAFSDPVAARAAACHPLFNLPLELGKRRFHADNQGILDLRNSLSPFPEALPSATSCDVPDAAIGASSRSEWKLDECLSCEAAIGDYGDFPDHAQFVEGLRQKHACKHGLWRLVEQ